MSATQLPIVWSDVEPWLASACAHARDGTTVEKLRASIERWESQLWIVYEGAPLAALVTTVVLDSRGRTLHVTSAGGRRMSRWITPIAAYLEGFARAKQCARIEFTGRPGWARALKKLGCKVTEITITKELQ